MSSRVATADHLKVNSHHKMGLILFNSIMVLFIIFLQFQNVMGVPIKESSPQLSHAIFLVDKVFFVSLVFVFFYARFLNGLMTLEAGKNNARAGFIALLKSEVILSASLIVFVLWCLISAAANQNRIDVTLNGTFVYVVYFFVFFVFSSISYTSGAIEKTYKSLLWFALILSMISIGQEVLALLNPETALWWPNIQTGEVVWRLGLFRAPSLLGHPNSIGMFALFFFTVELAKQREGGGEGGGEGGHGGGLKGSWLSIAILGSAVLFSVSRAAIGAAAIALVFLLRGFRRSVYLFLPMLILLAAVVFSDQKKGVDPAGGVFSYVEYREFVMEKSLDVFKDHLIFGTGPGMYGGHVSLKYGSPIYNQYDFTGVYYNYLHDRVGSIEQQWLQVLAELGLPGSLFFILLILTPVVILYRLLDRTGDAFSRALIAALMVMPFQMLYYMLGFSLTQQQEWLVPYFAFVGMLVGSQRRSEG